MRDPGADLEHKLQVLRSNIYFDELPEALLREVAAHMQLREYERGEMLFWEGDPCNGLHIIEKGSVRLYRLSSQGREYIVRVLQDGDTCNEVPAFDGGTNPVNVEALGATRAWVIEAPTLLQLVQSQPQFAQKVLVNFAQNLRMLVRTVSELAFYQVTNRLARLIDETEDLAHGSPPLTHEQLAARLGTVREVVSRSLKELERSGAIRIEERRISVVDRQALAQWTST